LGPFFLWGAIRMPSNLVLIYTTVATRDAALILARGAVAARLAACANIIPSITAVYEWQGVLEEGDEMGIIFKTTVEQAGPLREYLEREHPYETPPIITWSVECNQQFQLFLQRACE